MLKRLLLSLTFIAALGVATVFTAGTASAYGDCGYDGYGNGYGYRTAYYPSYGASYYSYGPRVVAYPRAYPVYYRDRHGRGWDDDHHHHRHHRHGHHHDSGVTFTFGF
jgi:hypothetical protein